MNSYLVKALVTIDNAKLALFIDIIEVGHEAEILERLKSVKTIESVDVGSLEFVELNSEIKSLISLMGYPKFNWMNGKIGRLSQALTSQDMVNQISTIAGLSSTEVGAKFYEMIKFIEDFSGKSIKRLRKDTFPLLFV